MNKLRVKYAEIFRDATNLGALFGSYYAGYDQDVSNYLIFMF